MASSTCTRMIGSYSTVTWATRRRSMRISTTARWECCLLTTTKVGRHLTLDAGKYILHCFCYAVFNIFIITTIVTINHVKQWYTCSLICTIKIQLLNSSLQFTDDDIGNFCRTDTLMKIGKSFWQGMRCTPGRKTQVKNYGMSDKRHLALLCITTNL